MAPTSSSSSDEMDPTIGNSNNRRQALLRRTTNNRRQRMSSMPTNLSPTERLRQSGLRTQNCLLIKLLSEFFATFVLLFVGSGAVAQFVLSRGQLNNFNQVSMTWGVLISLCVFATYHTSGGHMNPAVSLAMCSLGKLPCAHFPLYALVQTFGAFVGAALAFHVYVDQIDRFDDGKRSIGGPTGTGHIFCSFPQSHVSHYTAFIDQIVGTGLLLFAICALVDPRNRVPQFIHPIGFGAAIFMISSSFGMNLGSPINPARDFGPRLFLSLAGYGFEAFSWHDFYFWVPIIAPFPGALIGCWFYQLFIGIQTPEELEETNNTQQKRRQQLGIDEEETNPLNSNSLLP